MTTLFPGYLIATSRCKSFGRSHGSFDGLATATWTNVNRHNHIAEVAMGLSRTEHLASSFYYRDDYRSGPPEKGKDNRSCYLFFRSGYIPDWRLSGVRLKTRVV